MSCEFITSRISEPPLVLASGSPRRSAILRGLDVDFVLEPHLTEELERAGETPQEHVVRLAAEKALDVASRRERGTVLGADTIVLMDGAVIGKPRDEAQAGAMLAALEGRTHDVLTGVALVRASDSVTVTGSLSSDEIASYVEHGEPMDKAGSYAIQDCGAGLVSRVEGCFYNVVGLPVVRTIELLDELAGR